jgi:hypothetical protein
LTLQRQTPASTIPRFNPHGYQAPPQERKPETEITSPMKRTFGSSAMRQEKEKVDFKSFKIDDLLMEKVSFNSLVISRYGGSFRFDIFKYYD